MAPVTGRRVPALTARDLAIEQDPGRDHAEQNTHPYNHPERLYPEAVFEPGPLRPPGAMQSRGRDETLRLASSEATTA